MLFFTAKLRPQASQEVVWDRLSELGAEHLMFIEEATETQVIASFATSSPPSLDELEAWIPYSMGEVDWEQQWEDHLPSYEDGLLKLPYLSQEIYLTAGPGFGDANHPTTELMLELMKGRLQDRYVVDMGCGSGILSFAAALCGAQPIIGVDIDKAALDHAQKNLSLNSWAPPISFILAEDFELQKPAVLLLNMISSEQEVVWKAHPSLHQQVQEILSSGVRIEEKREYLERWQSRGWTPTLLQEKEGWLAFLFSPSHSDPCIFS